MKLIIGKEYKVKRVVDGMETPGGYYRVVKKDGGKILFEVLDKHHETAGGVFTMSADRFEKLIEDEDE